MEIIQDFAPADRYVYDFGLCSTKNGFAQVDTSQDASYYGTWASPKRMMTVCYAEGDVIISKCANPQEFIDEIRKCKKWNEDNGYRFIGIDPGFNRSLRMQFEILGLGDLLH